MVSQLVTFLKVWSWHKPQKINQMQLDHPPNTRHSAPEVGKSNQSPENAEPVNQVHCTQSHYFRKHIGFEVLDLAFLVF